MKYDVDSTEAFVEWFEGLADHVARVAITKRIIRAQSGLLGNTRSIGGGVSEMKVDVGPGYRVYYTIRGRKLVLLLTGGDKSSQKRDIKAAKAMVDQLD
jgi:putative addiction module killer protein